MGDVVNLCQVIEQRGKEDAEFWNSVDNGTFNAEEWEFPEMVKAIISNVCIYHACHNAGVKRTLSVKELIDLTEYVKKHSIILNECLKVLDPLQLWGKGS